MEEGTLSLPHHQMRAAYQVVVVGSGYGAAVCAARLAESGASVCVLERGREFARGGFPRTFGQTLDEMRFDFGHTHHGQPGALFDFHLDPDLSIVSGCGLGGTSLINAAVVAAPVPQVWEHPAWPQAIRNEHALGELERYFQRAHHVLRPVPLGDEPGPAKLRALHDGGATSGGRFTRLDLAIHFAPEATNHVGVVQRPCIRCSDCVTGCNFQAKSSLTFNYLPLARRFGAAIFTGCTVIAVTPAPAGGFRVHWVHTSDDDGEAREQTMLAQNVVLGGGVLGSTAILLRSAARGLPVATRWVGQRVSGNGDAITFGYRCDRPIHAVGRGAAAEELPLERRPGPTITAAVDLRDPTAPSAQGLVIAEGAIPSPIADTLGLALPLFARIGGENVASGVGEWLRARGQELADLFGAHELGALERTMIYLSIGHDGAGGRISLTTSGRPHIDWPELRHQPVFRQASEVIRQITHRLGGEHVRDPIETALLGRQLITVHPLGGCPMGEDAAAGAVDHAGRVFTGNPKDTHQVHRGLYVADAAIIPTSLGINPLYTISALAERVAEHAARDLGLVPRASVAVNG